MDAFNHYIPGERPAYMHRLYIDTHSEYMNAPYRMGVNSIYGRDVKCIDTKRIEALRQAAKVIRKMNNPPSGEFAELGVMLEIAKFILGE
ncbi:MAG TPA: hypothetical protein VN861_14730 [Candidatus Acidoferrales bacterium]|nr:hypothetical protein [Candidatus Acidoferrales bacterium]